MQIVRCSLKVSVKPFQRLADLQGSALQQVWAAAQYSMNTRKMRLKAHLQDVWTSWALPKPIKDLALETHNFSRKIE